MGWQKGVEELYRRRARALEMGGQEKVRLQHEQGKLTARERINLLFDQGTFIEYGMLAKSQSNRPEMANKPTPADAVITGYGKINGRMACVIAEDFTVLGGSVGITHMLKNMRFIQLAQDMKVPIVWLMDGAGARAEETINMGLPPVTHFLEIARLSGIAPQVGVAMGPCSGDSSLQTSLLEFIIQVKGHGMLFAGGPPVVYSAIGEIISKEDLGGTNVHCRISGVADNEAESDEHAISLVKEYLSYLPLNAYEYPPYKPTADKFDRMDEELLNIVPEQFMEPYDMKQIISYIVDDCNFFEIKPYFGASLITALARLGGHSVGIIANQPNVRAGALDAKAAMKMRHFIDLCSSYHIPLIFLVDVPGVMTGSQAEREGTLRAGLAVAYSLAYADVPKITVVIRKAFGFGGAAMCGYGARQAAVFAWPSADFGAIPSKGGVLAIYKKEIETAADPEAKIKELEAQFEEYKGPFSAAATFNVDDVIDPRETRPKIIRALELALNCRSKPAQPVPRFGVMP
ncbi:acyl-CoA carboxylase subunit beta [Desulfallas sp. Bu1-1]|uniref:acyl-CoA carboxylase subunit beta n=1 Tax=Desulfallas sp. Bu1-1 TaxID=2787620 RepID=UPI00189F5F86|nr:carboxyl transferase domain-containing protein [Desulfallas sp. Bu1-1]MBF7082748.1 acyl-CoA carboxylase subunit beta [Desulfallas sp. Bu1-1]